MKFVKNMWSVAVFLIFLAALCLRIYKLDSVPYGFHIDEVKAGWNAYSILKTAHDDKGNFLPMYYDSFGDFRPAGLIYLIIPSLVLFGKTIFAVRFPFAFVGALTVIPMFLFVFEISRRKNKLLPFLSSCLLALNPWHIIVSRGTSEGVVTLFLALFGLYFFVRANRTRRWVDVFLSIGLILFSFLFYHSIRVLAPIFLLMVVVYYNWILVRTAELKQIVGFAFVLLMSIFVFLSPESRERMSQVSLKSDFQILYEVTKMPAEEGPGHVVAARVFHNRISSYMRRFAEEYKEYFATDFLIGSSQKPVRYFVPYVGLLTYIEFLFVVIGLFWVTKRRELLLVLALLVVSPLPSAVTNEDTPNMIRSIFMVPFLMALGGYGLYGLFKLNRKYKFVFWMGGVLYLLNFVYFFHMYIVHQKMSLASYYRNGGSIELAVELGVIKNNYKNIYLTNSPDSLYPWIAFGLFDKPNDFNLKYFAKNNMAVVDNFVFTNNKCPINFALENGYVDWSESLFVEAEGCVLDDRYMTKVKIGTIKTISRPDNSPPFYLRVVEPI